MPNLLNFPGGIIVDQKLWQTDTPKNVGWVEQSETQHSLFFLTFECMTSPLGGARLAGKSAFIIVRTYAMALTDIILLKMY